MYEYIKNNYYTHIHTLWEKKREWEGFFFSYTLWIKMNKDFSVPIHFDISFMSFG